MYGTREGSIPSRPLNKSNTNRCYGITILCAMRNRMTQLLNDKYTAEQRAAVLIDYFANNGETLPCSSQGWKGVDLNFKSGIVVIPSTQVSAPLRYFWEALTSNFFRDYGVEIDCVDKFYEEAAEELKKNNPDDSTLGGYRSFCYEDVILQYVLLGHPLIINDNEQVMGVATLFHKDIIGNFVKAVASNDNTELALRWLQQFQVCQHDAIVTDGFLQFCIYGDLIFG